MLEFPDIEQNIWQRYADLGVQVVGINPGRSFDTTAQVEAFIEQTGVTFPVGWDQSFSYSQLIPSKRISPYPVDVVIDPDGNIAYLEAEYRAGAMLNAVESLLAK